MNPALANPMTASVAEQVVFWLLSAMTVFFAFFTMTRRNPVTAVMSLVATFFCLAGIYATLSAHFLAILQVLVYAGAIMVVFLFVIMLLNLGQASALADARGMGWKLAAGLVGLALLAQIAALTHARLPEALTLRENAVADMVARDGAIAPLAGPLFKEYLLAFEVTSVLLLAAVVGAVVLGKRKERDRAL
jgi:NADH-quinone oxidoreductase subunit J